MNRGDTSKPDKDSLLQKLYIYVCTPFYYGRKEAMNKRLIFIFLIAGLIAAKGLFADGPKIGSSFQDEFNCENPVIGELLVKLMSAEDNKLRLLKLNHQNKMEVATLDVAGDGVIEFNNVGFGGLENIFNKNNYKITKVESLQSVFENGKNKGKSPEGATGLRSYTNAPIMKIGFEKINMAKGEKTFTAQRRDIRTDYRENKRYNFQSLSRIINYKREINRFLPVLSNFVSENNRSAIEGNKVEFIIPVCHNVKPTSYTPSPQYVNDPAFSYGDVWALKNWFGFYYGLIDVDLNYNDGWRMMYQVWRLLPPERRVMSIVGAGLDDRPGLQQNLDVVNVINGSYVASGLGAGEYYDFLGSNHELAVTSIALAGNNNLLGMPGFTTGRAFLSVCNDGTPVTNADFIEAIDQAANYSALVNISYTYSGNDPAIYQVLDSLGPRNVIAVFGAANDGLNLDSIIPGEPRGHPCRLSDTLSNILCVAGIDPGGNLATSFVGGARTNWGDIRVHTAAPAQDVLIARPGGYLVTAGGTSYAPPFLS